MINYSQTNRRIIIAVLVGKRCRQLWTMMKIGCLTMYNMKVLLSFCPMDGICTIGLRYHRIWVILIRICFHMTITYYFTRIKTSSTSTPKTICSPLITSNKRMHKILKTILIAMQLESSWQYEKKLLPILMMPLDWCCHSMGIKKVMTQHPNRLQV